MYPYSLEIWAPHLHGIGEFVVLGAEINTSRANLVAVGTQCILPTLDASEDV